MDTLEHKHIDKIEFSFNNIMPTKSFNYFDAANISIEITCNYSGASILESLYGINVCLASLAPYGDSIVYYRLY